MKSCLPGKYVRGGKVCEGCDEKEEDGESEKQEAAENAGDDDCEEDPEDEHVNQNQTENTYSQLNNAN